DKDAAERIAISVAGDDQLAVRQVMRLVDRLGFDPVDAGPLKNGLFLEPDGSPIAATYSAEGLAKLIPTHHLNRDPVRASSPRAGDEDRQGEVASGRAT